MLSEPHASRSASEVAPQARPGTPLTIEIDQATDGTWIAPARHEHELGARPTPGGTLFRVWTTRAARVAAVIYDDLGVELAAYPLGEQSAGVFEALVPEVGPGARYKFRLDDEVWPDPYARCLPAGPHGAAVVWRNDYRWKHPPPNVPRERLVIYELHVGAFTPEGTLQGAIAKLAHLRDLGVTAIELMPLASFPGARGWGYDGVAPFAPFAGYGTPEDLCAFVDEAHGHGMVVLLDAVFNHLGPDGNYLGVYAPAYFTDRHKTPWGDAPDFANSFMRRLVLDAAAHWLGEYRLDGLRLDATHAIVDEQAPHLLAELAALAHRMPQRPLLIAEDDRNEPMLVEGFGLDAVWADDFHHHVHVLLTREQDGYYADYVPSVADLARTIQHGWFYEGQLAPVCGKPRGKPATGLAPWRFVYCLQNHDQVGNRAAGDRLTAHLSPERWRLPTLLLLFLPMTPLLFMGQEWGATTPFPYFSDHAGALGEAVTRGRREDFARFAAFQGQDPPDPQALATFQAAKLAWPEAEEPARAALLAFHRELLRLRREDPVLAAVAGEPPEAGAIGELLWVRRRVGDDERLLLANFGAAAVALADVGAPGGATALVGTGAFDGATLAPGEGVVLVLRRPRIAIPGSTYRLQLHQGFDFARASALLPYLQALGVTDVYTSPYFVAEPGSTHGYNVASHADVNPELGGVAGYRHFTDRLRLRGMGHILDMVPNHMGIADGSNAWWRDVLENGPASRYADHFDIEWRSGTPGLDGKVLLPILGDQYGNVLERGELRLEREGGAFWVRYWARRLPVAPDTLVPILARAASLVGQAETEPAMMELGSLLSALRHLPPQAATDEAARTERAREKEVVKRRIGALCDADAGVCHAIDRATEELNGHVGEPATFDRLDALLRDQPYRLSYWRVATEEINYRRFFDINDLAAIRMERPEVFNETHHLLLGFVREGRITGLRLDHTDGLYDPLGYFLALQRARADQLGIAPDARPLYLLAEKILEPGEQLPRGWPIHGTTGYDFMGLVGGLWVDARAEREVSSTYQRFTRQRMTFDEIVHRSKRLIMRWSLSSEVNVLARQLDRIAEGNRRARDFTLVSLTTAIVETIAAFPVYRTYIREDGTREEPDDRHVETAIRRAKRRNPELNATIFDFLRDILLLRFPDNATPAQIEAQTRFALKFQQVTSPVMAKGVEDTAFYTYNRLVCLNDVGGAPDRFGTAVATFHAGNAIRARDWPGSLLATATHDHKRGEDTRARIAVLSECQPAWREALAIWSRLARAKKTDLDGDHAPARNDEYLFYQVALGAWPLDGEFGGFAERLRAYMLKATREAKAHTSWINPDQAYDDAVARFVDEMLGDDRCHRTMARLALAIGPHGATNGLAQVLLKLTAPGVPDTYQGCELWDQSLVDPDNRRPVDYALRARMLADIRERIADPAALAADLLGRWRDGAVKLFVTHRALQVRGAHAALFREGTYRPLEAGEHAVAFAREQGETRILVVAPRLTWTLTGGAPGFALGDAWGEHALALPAGGRWRNAFTGELVAGETTVPLAAVFKSFPVALLVPA